MDLPCVPLPFTVVGSFTAAGNPPPVVNQMPTSEQISGRDVLIEGVDVDIQTPNWNTAALLKPEGDDFYNRTSGIQAIVRARGQFGREFEIMPLRALSKLITPVKPWVLLMDEKLSMDFFVTTALPTQVTTITVTFLGCTAPKDTVFRTPLPDIFACLDKLGYDTSWGRKLFACVV